jgi:hypothetical protein
MPFKANAARRHRIPKQQYRVTNRAEYDASLRQRGSLTVWFSDEAIAAWRAEAPHDPQWSAPLFGFGDPDGVDAASRIPVGAASDRGANRLDPSALGSGSGGAGSSNT